MSKLEARLGWGFFWLTTGVCAVVALIAAPDIPSWSIKALLVLAGVSGTVSAYFFRWFHAKTFAIGTVVRTVLILTVLWGAIGYLGYLVWPRVKLPEMPEIVILSYRPDLFHPPNKPYVNVNIQNIGADGVSSAIAFVKIVPVDSDERVIKKELRDLVDKSVHQSTAGENNLRFAIKKHETKYFSPMATDASPEQVESLRAGKSEFFFVGTVLVNDGKGKSNDFCGFVLGDHPNTVLMCTE